MSSTNRGAERKDSDAYYTQPELAHALVQKLQPDRARRFFEPHAGRGAFVDAINAYTGRTVLLANDVQDVTVNALCVGEQDFRTVTMTTMAAAAQWEYELATGWPGDRAWFARPEDWWIIGNPPYTDWEEHLEHALSLVSNVAFLLPLNRLGCTKRRPVEWWERNAPSHLIVSGTRPSFTEDGRKDSTEYALYVWARSPGACGLAPGVHWCTWTPAPRGKRVKNHMVVD